MTDITLELLICALSLCKQTQETTINERQKETAIALGKK